MKMTTRGCSKFEALMLQEANGVISTPERVRLMAHLEGCESCARSFESYEEIFSSVAERVRSEPPVEFWEGYYDRLQEKLGRQHPDSSPGPLGSRLAEYLSGLISALGPVRPALGIAVVIALVGAGVFLGRSDLFKRTDPETALTGTGTLPEETRAEAELYMERSRTVLLGLANFDSKQDDPDLLNLPRRREIAQVLVNRTPELKSALARTDQDRLRRLIADLEVILIQIANMDQTSDLVEIETVKSGVDRKALLFKIDIQEMLRIEQTQSLTNPSVTDGLY
jgi:Putative zinc-finger